MDGYKRRNQNLFLIYYIYRSAFLSKGHTIHLFIQNNQAWLEKNQVKKKSILRMDM